MVFTGISRTCPRQEAATEQAEPLTMALQYANLGSFVVGVVAFGSVVAHTAVLLVFQLGQPRIFFSMARDGLLPPSFAKVHPRFRTPYVTTILTGVLVGVCAMFTSIDEMVDLTNIGTLFAFLLVCIGIIILRIKDPGRERGFRVPGGTWLIPILGAASCLVLASYLPSTSWKRFGIWLAIGLVVYFSTAKRSVPAHVRARRRTPCTDRERVARSERVHTVKVWLPDGVNRYAVSFEQQQPLGTKCDADQA
jgi:APA family basic amino acid/polyamine antiporter